MDNIGKIASNLGSGSGAAVGRPLFEGASGPSWEDLRSRAVDTHRGQILEDNKR